MKEGDQVNFHERIGGEITSTGHTITTIHTMPNNFGEDVAWISGKSGCVALAALSLASVKVGLTRVGKTRMSGVVIVDTSL